LDPRASVEGSGSEGDDHDRHEGSSGLEGNSKRGDEAGAASHESVELGGQAIRCAPAPVVLVPLG